MVVFLDTCSRRWRRGGRLPLRGRPLGTCPSPQWRFRAEPDRAQLNFPEEYGCLLTYLCSVAVKSSRDTLRRQQLSCLGDNHASTLSVFGSSSLTKKPSGFGLVAVLAQLEWQCSPFESVTCGCKLGYSSGGIGLPGDQTKIPFWWTFAPYPSTFLGPEMSGGPYFTNKICSIGTTSRLLKSVVAPLEPVRSMI